MATVHQTLRICKVPPAAGGAKILVRQPNGLFAVFDCGQARFVRMNLSRVDARSWCPWWDRCDFNDALRSRNRWDDCCRAMRERHPHEAEEFIEVGYQPVVVWPPEESGSAEEEDGRERHPAAGPRTIETSRDFPTGYP